MAPFSDMHNKFSPDLSPPKATPETATKPATSGTHPRSPRSLRHRPLQQTRSPRQALLASAGIAAMVLLILAWGLAASSASSVTCRTKGLDWVCGPESGIVTRVYYWGLWVAKYFCGNKMMDCRSD